MLKLNFQYFGHLMRRAESLEKSLMMGKMEGKEKGTTEDEMVGWHHQLNGQVSANSATPWTAARQAPLSFTGSQNLLKLVH